MKQLLFFTSALCFLIIPLKGTAQGSDATSGPGIVIDIGAKAGTGFSQFSQPGNVISAYAGAFGRYQAFSFLEVQLDLGYDLSGGGRTDLPRDPELLGVDENFSDAPNVITGLNYLNRQVFFHAVKGQLSARLSLPELEIATIQPKLILGASGAYIFRAMENHDSHFTFGDGVRVMLPDQWENVAGDYDSLNWAAHLGFALDFDMPNGKTFSLELVYEHGFNDLNGIVVGQPENVNTIRTQRIEFLFSYTLFRP